MKACKPTKSDARLWCVSTVSGGKDINQDDMQSSRDAIQTKHIFVVIIASTITWMLSNFVSNINPST